MSQNDKFKNMYAFIEQRAAIITLVKQVKTRLTVKEFLQAYTLTDEEFNLLLSDLYSLRLIRSANIDLAVWEGNYR